MNNHIVVTVRKSIGQMSVIKKILILVAILGIGYLGYTKSFPATKVATKYQTSTVEKGTLIVVVTGSGQVSTANNGIISTQASGVVSKLYVKDGDQVKTGDKIADIDLDLPGQQTSAQALASYQSAQNNLQNAQSAMYTTQSTMFTQWKNFYNLATNSTYQNADGTPNNDNRALVDFNIPKNDWLAAEAKYKTQQNTVAQAQTSLNSAWLSYQQSSPTIYAPISGTVSGLSLQVGSVIASTQSTSSSNSTQSATKIASIKTQALPAVSINLTEIDIPKIKINDKATMTFDALPDKTFTGKVVSIDTTGNVSSGVTTYPTVIRLDIDSENILTNMAATANIITATKDNVLLAPISAIQKQTDGTKYVSILTNGLPRQVGVETGLASSTETEIISGLSEGDNIITNTVSTSSQTSNQSQSPFSGFGNNRGGMGGAVRINH